MDGQVTMSTQRAGPVPGKSGKVGLGVQHRRRENSVPKIIEPIALFNTQPLQLSPLTKTKDKIRASDAGRGVRADS
jgi:hypothetical protein